MLNHGGRIQAYAKQYGIAQTAGPYQNRSRQKFGQDCLKMKMI
jgi:hypothetical protein